MRSKGLNNRSNRPNQPGIALFVTLVLLVVLSTLTYTLSSRIAAQRHRDQYIIDYSSARYGCDSAARFALASLQDIEPKLISRPKEPDFSDLFSLTQAEYEELIRQWAEDKEALDSGDNFDDVNDIIDVNDVNNVSYPTDAVDSNDPNSYIIRGPYGPPWPFVAEPIELKIGSATVKIEIEDENAKYPIGWMVLNDIGLEREAQAGFEPFCEWMDVNDAQIDSLTRQLKEMSEIKPFKLKFKPIIIKEKKTIRSRRGRSRRGRTRVTTRKLPATVHTSDFAKLFHSSLIDTETIARPTIISKARKESALKYMGLWASSRVNINTAPRHVLEAAFTFGGDADKIAEEIIQRRRKRPFANINELKKALFRYSDSIEKCKEYITTISKCFTIRITAVSGVAKASTVIAITKDGKKIKQIATISG